MSEGDALRFADLEKAYDNVTKTTAQQLVGVRYRSDTQWGSK